MPVMWNDEAGTIEIFDASSCPSCGNDELYDSGCTAPGCRGFSCEECGWGCDRDFVGDGRCATAIEEEDDDEADARADRERAAFGLPPLSGGR